MKKIYLWMIVPFLISCSQDPAGSEHIEKTMKHSATSRTALPYNPNNAYDPAGQLHNELSEGFVVSGSLPTSVAATLAILDSIAKENALFHNLKEPTYIPPSTNRLEYILERSDTDLDDLLSHSSLSNIARAQLLKFTEQVHAMETSGADYDSIYHYIVSVEDKIMTNIALRQNDLRLLLTTTSITRHACYFAREQKKKPRDKDWDLVIANIIAAADGAETGSGTAATMAACAGIVSNY